MATNENIPMTVEARRTPSEPKDVYADVEEVLWKNIVVDAYKKVLTVLNDVQLLDDPVIRELHIRIIDTINSNHDKKVFNERSKIINHELKKRLIGLGLEATVKQIDEIIRNVGESMRHITDVLREAPTDTSHSEQTYVQDGVIRLAGQDIETFSNKRDYFKATLELMNETSVEAVGRARLSFEEGFRLTQEEANFVEKSIREHWDITEVITSILILQQTSGTFPSIQNYEHQPRLSFEENQKRKLSAIDEAYFLMGKIISSIAVFSSSEDTQSQQTEEMGDPIVAFLRRSGKVPTQQQVDAVRKIALAHSSHGLNSGELTARLAGSVRTSFPRALIASFNIRSGVLHSGAIKECMAQTEQFLAGHQDAATFVRSTIERGEKLYGFGHRIHKTNSEDPVELLGKDPRVTLYIRTTLEGFPEKAGTVRLLIKYAEAIRRDRPSLGANTDFGAAVLFHALELSPQVAEGFFAAFRCAGICANVVNELNVKGNSRRPPFPTVLSYPTQ